jgi:acetyl/propionyl-CoA carboxylase alpha subunit
MAYTAEFQGRTHRLLVSGEGSPAAVQLDETTCEVDFTPVGGGLFSLLVDGRSYVVDVVEEGEGLLVVWVNGEPHHIEFHEEGRRRPRPTAAPSPGTRGRQAIAAPMPGKVVKLLVAPGQQVSAGQGVIVVEAMKMENELKASAPGVVKEVRVQEGAGVGGGEVLVVIE